MYFERCLFKTHSFLNDMGKTESSSNAICPKTKSAISLFLQNDFFSVIELLEGCDSDDHLSFIREYCNILQNKTAYTGKIQSPFRRYLAVLSGRCSIIEIFSTLSEHPDFYEAFDLLLHKYTPNLRNSTLKWISSVDDDDLRCFYILSLYLLHGFQVTDLPIDHCISRLLRIRACCNLVGAVYFKLKDISKGLALFENFKDLKYVDHLSNVLYLRKDEELLIEIYKQAQAISSTRPEVFCILGNLFSLRNEHALAILSFEKAISQDNKFRHLYTLIGHEHLEIKQYEYAEKCYKLAIQLNQYDYRAWYGIAHLFYEKERYSEAVVCFRRCVESRPTDIDLWVSLADSLIKITRYDDAVGCYLRISDNLGCSDGYLKIGDLYKGLKDYSKSIMYYEKYISINNGDRRICKFLIEYFKKIGDIDKKLLYEKIYNTT